jgi:hypothetical protein
LRRKRYQISGIRFVTNGAPPEEKRGKRDDQGDTIDGQIGEIDFEIFMKGRQGPERRAEVRSQNLAKGSSDFRLRLLDSVF